MDKIIEKFDMAALRKSRQQKSTKTDLIGGLRQLSPEIEKLKVGQTAVVTCTKDTLRKTVMQITAKLNHLCARGGEWAGKDYDVASDGEGTVYVQRQKGCKAEEAPERKKGGGGGRPRKVKAETAPATDEPATDHVELTDGAKIIEHA